MSHRNSLFTSESVSMGHPDKVSDQVSDAIVDAIYLGTPEGERRNVRVAVETLVTTDQVVLAGEVRHNADVDYEAVARKAIEEIGYTHDDIGFDFKTCKVLNLIHGQSADIARGVDMAADAGDQPEQGAGDQGLMFGFACRETDVLMPLPIHLSHRIVEKQAELRQNGTLKWLRPDAKSQVTVLYEGQKPVKVQTVVLSTQHDKSVMKGDLMSEDAKRELIEKVIRPCIPQEYFADDIRYHVNPTGSFVVGGPHGDCGLTGRKIIVDTYGGRGRHGGGAFSGKDPSKVDRSAAYMARYVAKNVVASGLADEVEVQLAYAIGVAKPVSIDVNTFGTAKVPETEIADRIARTFDLRPNGIIGGLGLLKPIFHTTARHGHFGRTPGSDGSFSWEKTDKADALKA